MPAEKFKDAILWLTQQNQDYVNKHGVNSYSRKRDQVICDLVNFYNQIKNNDPDLEAEEREFHISKLQDEIERLRTIIKLFNINPGQFAGISGEFLQHKLKQRIKDQEMLFIEPIYFLDITNDWLIFQTEVETVVSFIKGYQMARLYKLNDLIKYYQGKKFDHIRKYFELIELFPDTNEQDLRLSIEKDYEGQFAAQTDQETNIIREAGQ